MACLLRPVLGAVITCVDVCFQMTFQFVGWVGDQTLLSVFCSGLLKKVKALVSQSCPTHVACPAPLSMGFSRQEYWSGLLLPSPGDLPNPGIEPGSPALQANSLLSEPRGARRKGRAEGGDSILADVHTYL